MFDETSLPPDPDEKEHPEVDSESKEPPSQDTLERLAIAIEMKAMVGHDMRDRVEDENDPNFGEVEGDPHEQTGQWINHLDTKTKTGDSQAVRVKWYTERSRPIEFGQATLGEAWAYHDGQGVEGADTFKLLETPDGRAVVKYLGARPPSTAAEREAQAKRSWKEVQETLQASTDADRALQRELGISFVSDTEAMDLAKQIEEGTPQSQKDRQE